MKKLIFIITLIGITIVLPSQSVLKEDSLVGTMKVRKTSSTVPKIKREEGDQLKKEAQEQIKNKIKLPKF